MVPGPPGTQAANAAKFGRVFAQDLGRTGCHGVDRQTGRQRFSHRSAAILRQWPTARRHSESVGGWLRVYREHLFRYAPCGNVARDRERPDAPTEKPHLEAKAPTGGKKSSFSVPAYAGQIPPLRDSFSGSHFHPRIHGAHHLREHRLLSGILSSPHNAGHTDFVLDVSDLPFFHPRIGGGTRAT